MYALRPPAEPGMPIEDVDTPALIVDLDIFEANMARLADETKRGGIRLRPHGKTHKCAIIAQQQIARGAVGQCVQKVSEAEALVDGGITDVLVCNEIVGQTKLRRLASLARRARIGVCVDNVANIEELSIEAQSFGVDLRVLVEIDAGVGRCGIEPGEPAAQLAKLIDELPGLTFGGLQAYHGGAQHLRTLAERKAAIAGIVDKVNQTRAALQRAGLPCPEVTGGGTGTYRLEMESGVYTELQCGSYIFMDADYGRNRDEAGEPFRRFAQSLFVYTTVMSRPARDRAIVDAGLKAVSIDCGPPLIHDQPDLEYIFKGDEHGQVRLPDTGHSLHVGSKLLLVPGHCDPTVNMYDHFVGVRDGWVESVWPITGRGPGR